MKYMLMMHVPTRGDYAIASSPKSAIRAHITRAAQLRERSTPR